MAHMLTDRDRQCGKEQAWHGLTTIVECVDRESSMPFEVIPCELYFQNPNPDEGFGFKQIEGSKILIANDDSLPIGEPYDPDSYFPNTIENFWEVLRKGLEGVDHEVVSAGSVKDRQNIFASIRITDGFYVGDKEFKDFLTIVDSFDKTISFQARYSNVCVVCNNTFQAVMFAGSSVGKAKHTTSFDGNVKRLVEAIDQFCGTSKKFNLLLSEANEVSTSKEHARQWFAGIEGRNIKDEPPNSLLDKTAHMLHLFSEGRGNRGQTRLDAFSALTEYHTHFSSNRKESTAQWATSEWGSSAAVKTLAVNSLDRDWDRIRSHGERLLATTNK